MQGRYLRLQIVISLLLTLAGNAPAEVIYVDVGCEMISEWWFDDKEVDHNGIGIANYSKCSATIKNHIFDSITSKSSVK